MIEVLKFGGSSLHNLEARKAVTNIIKNHLDHKLIIVVSAMGRYPDAYATQTLESLISSKISIQESQRMISVGEIISAVILSNTLNQEDIKAISLSSNQAGLLVENEYLQGVNKHYFEQLFKEYDVIIVPGFQGIDQNNEIVTLATGDSDYSAVFLAQQFGLDKVIIYSDVSGIYSADPKIIPSAKLISKISYQQAIDLASHKARIICLKALQEANKVEDFEIILKSTYQKEGQTKIINQCNEVKTMSIDFDYYMIYFEDGINQESENKTFEKILDCYMITKENLTKIKQNYMIINEYVKIHLVGCYLENEEIYLSFLEDKCIASKNEIDSYYIDKRHSVINIKLIHDILVKGE